MASVSARRRPERERVLVPARRGCPGCGGHMRLRYENRRTLVTLSGQVRLRLWIRRCEAPGCRRYHVPYRPGLFHCHAVPGLPATNNDLKQLFGAARYHERRATGRKTASAATVLRGPVRVIASIATRTRPPTARDLGRADRRTWMELRRHLDARRQARIQRCRFRRDPDAYLANLERLARQPALPA